MSWNRAMDEVRVERLMQKYKDNGEQVNKDPALVVLKQWPASKQYRDNSDRHPGLEQLVCIMQGAKFKRMPGSKFATSYENLLATLKILVVKLIEARLHGDWCT